MALDMYAFYQQSTWMMVCFVLLIIWETVWKGFGLWYSARNKQTPWFVAMLVFFTFGILPIIYLAWFKPKEKVPVEVKGVSVKKKKKK